MDKRLCDPIKRLHLALRASGSGSSDFSMHDARVPLRPAAVLVGFHSDGRLVLTQRATGLRTHSGQIAFPGGTQDPEDANLVQTALRESREEIGLAPDAVQILGLLPPHETLTGFKVTPVMAHITREFTPVPAPDEVAKVFTLPFDHITDPGNFRTERIMYRGRLRDYVSAPYGPFYIWGATARILRDLAGRL